MSKALVITEKPSVAGDIAAALGGFRELDGYWENDGYLVTFAVGHLFELLSPEEVDEKYKRWSLDVLPILPDTFKLKKKKGQSERIGLIKRLAARNDVDRLVNACDAGREGELIFDEVVEFLELDKPVERLWLQSMTQTAIREGFAGLQPGADFQGLAAAARCRAQSDWLIGMNATRAITRRLQSRKEKTAWSAGRVQTPTLALLVDREFDVLAHVPKPYWKVTGRFRHGDHHYEGVWYDPDFRKRENDEQARDDRIFDAERARAVVEAVQGKSGLASETRKPSRQPAPLLFDLTTLQRTAGSRYGWSARRTLGAAQRCYERHKLLTYPRTDSRCLPEDYRGKVREVLNKFAGAARADLEDYKHAAQHLLNAGMQNEKRTYNNAGVSDHFAVIPTGALPSPAVSGDDLKLFDLVMRRFLGNFYPPAVYEAVDRRTEVAEQHFRTSVRALMIPGWRAVLPASEREGDAPLPPLAQPQDAAPDAPAPGKTPKESHTEGVPVDTEQVESEQLETKPPSRISEARLLGMMENAGKLVEDEEIAAALKEKGIGTPATRADIIENLISKGYVLRAGSSLRPTVKGIRLIDTLNRIEIKRLASAELTGEIEQHLYDVQHNKRTADDFMQEIKEYASEIVELTKSFDYDDLYKDVEPLGACPRCERPVIEMTWFYRCEPLPEASQDDKAKEDAQEDCPMRFWKDTSGRYLNRSVVRTLLQEGRTGVLDGFTSRDGRTYKGAIEIDTDEWKLSVQSEGWSQEGGFKLPEYDIDPEPLGACPMHPGSDCKVSETPTHFACSTQQAYEQSLAEYQDARKRAKEEGEKAPKKPAKPEPPGLILPRTVCKREITRGEALHYLAHGKTELLEDFTSRRGRPFSATLFRKETGRHGFEFPPRKGAARGGARGGARRKAASARGARKKTTRKKATRKKAARKKPRQRRRR